MMDLSEKVVAVHLSISVWTAKKIDREVSDEVADDKGVARTTGRYKKRLIPSRHLGHLRSVARAARNYHKSRTLPWLQEEGVGLLPIGDLVEYTTELRKIQESYQKAVTRFITAYPSILEEARNTMKSLFKEDDYPSQHSLRRKFAFNLGMMQLPNASTLPSILQSDTGAEVRHQLEDYISTGVAEAMQHLWEQFKSGLENLAGMLANPESVVRQNTIRNLRSLCSTVAKLNLTDDPRLNDIRTQAEAMLKDLDPEELAKSTLAKGKAITQVDDLLKKFEKYAAPPPAGEAK